MRRMVILIAVLSLLSFTYCGNIRAEEQSEQSIWCTPPAALGQTKGQVEKDWGAPDEVIDLGYDEVGIPKEEWVYVSKPTSVLDEHTYVCRTQRLIFTGDYLTEHTSGKTLKGEK